MPFSHRNSMVQRGVNRVNIESGQIINVKTKSWLVDVRTQHTQRILLDLQVGTPYLHYHSGEGIYAMPEVGAKVMVCMPSDSTPFVLCFVTTFEREAIDGVGDNPTDTDLEGSASEVTYRAGRPKLQQGDIALQTRDGNRLWLRRGGLVEIGSTHIAKRFYIPLTNMIRDVCENYQMLSLAGDMMWTTARADTDPEGEARALFTIAARNNAQDAKSSVLVQYGHVDDTIHVKCIVAPNAIDPVTGDIEGDAVYTFTIDSEGNIDAQAKGSLTSHIEGTVDLQVDGDTTLQYGANLTESVGGDHSLDVTGSQTTQSTNSTENLTGTKKISSSSIKLGGDGAVTPMMLATAQVIAFMAGHTHSVTGTATGPPITPVLPAQMQARKVYGE